MPSRAAEASRLTSACGGASAGEVLADGLAEAEAVADAVVDGAVQQRPRLLGHAEAAGAERGVDVLGRRSAEGDLEVVDDAGAVQRQRRHEAARHQVDEDRRQPGLDDVRAEAPDDRPAGGVRRPHRRHDRLEVGAAEQIGKAAATSPSARAASGRAKSATRTLLGRDASG